MTPFSNLRPRSRSKGPFARIPAWIFRDCDGLRFKGLKGSEAKLLFYLAFRANNQTDETPAFTCASLARATKLDRGTVRDALKVLENVGVLALIETKRGGTAARLLFFAPTATAKPTTDTAATDETTYPDLEAKLSIPVIRVRENPTDDAGISSNRMREISSSKAQFEDVEKSSAVPTENHSASEVDRGLFDQGLAGERTFFVDTPEGRAILARRRAEGLA